MSWLARVVVEESHDEVQAGLKQLGELVRGGLAGRTILDIRSQGREGMQACGSGVCARGGLDAPSKPIGRGCLPVREAGKGAGGWEGGAASGVDIHTLHKDI